MEKFQNIFSVSFKLWNCAIVLILLFVYFDFAINSAEGNETLAENYSQQNNNWDAGYLNSMFNSFKNDHFSFEQIIN